MSENYVTIRNNSQVPIHCALSWASIQQDFKNDIKPNGGYDEFVLHDIGLHDLTIIVGTKENRFQSGNNGKIDGMKILAAVMAGVNPAAAYQLFATGALKIEVAGDVPIEIGRPPTIINKGDAEIVEVPPKIDLRVHPLVITGLRTLDGNDVVVSGGEFVGEYAKPFKKFFVYEFKPLKAHWSNRLSNKSQKDYQAPSS
jgi:hypothetical protein